ncbi:MAG TPA: BTAD domain-containing putative transcriptional regulator, partial [Herpetosiphonaceae bacterium]|nr:BTAD domain-containing putative transcriptional regulator [Herpetosiphonaceae bacterium]
MRRRESAPELVPGSADGLHIQLLGGFRVLLGERAIAESDWRLRKAAGLFKLLALAPNHQIHRERVLERLWPDLEPRTATNNFHRTLHALRRILEPDRPSTWLRLQDDLLTLGQPGQVWVDVQAFEAACATARGACAPAPYYAALELYAGELLPADRYEDWAASRREHLHDLYLGLLLDLARLHEARQELPAAIDALRRVVEGEPAHEEAHTGLMRLYARSGQRHQALRQYGQLRDALLRELDAEPEEESKRLYQEIRSGLFPPRVSQSPVAPVAGDVPAPRHNLLAPLTSFVGREHELAEVGRLIATTRLLTLIGTGGCGKTRLALEVARGAVAAYEDGVWLVELAGLSDPGLVPRAVAGVLGVREDADRSLLDSLADAVRSRQLLLVLDNCEHLLDACAQLVETLLSSSPELRVLATSREALGTRGELQWRVPSLSVPPETSLPHLERLNRYASVALFLARARFRQPALDLTQENAPAVLQICRQLEGIPLAIELAAARASALPLEEIAARLDNSLGLLTGGGRLAAARHKTLRGVFDWSYELLSEAERQLFARVSVFA